MVVSHIANIHALECMKQYVNNVLTQQKCFWYNSPIVYVALTNISTLVAMATLKSYAEKHIHTSGVPQNVDVVPLGSMFSLHSPKSVRMMWPCESSKMFSGFRSRYTMLSECR